MKAQKNLNLAKIVTDETCRPGTHLAATVLYLDTSCSERTILQSTVMCWTASSESAVLSAQAQRLRLALNLSLSCQLHRQRKPLR